MVCVLVAVTAANCQVTYPPAPIFDRFAVYRGESDPTPAPPVYREPEPIYTTPAYSPPPAPQRTEGPCPVLNKDAAFPPPNFPVIYNILWVIKKVTQQLIKLL